MATTFTAHEVAAGFGFLEGPRWHGGALWASDFFRHGVVRVDLDSGAVDEVCRVPQQPSGLAFAPDGTLLVVSMLDRRVLRVTTSGTELVADLSGLTARPLNDMTIDAQGRLYVGSFGSLPGGDPALRPAPILRIDPDGAVAIVSRDLTFPNGLVLDAEQRTLFVADTFASRIAVFDVAADGSLALTATIPLGGAEHATAADAWATRDFLPDGLAIDADDTVWIADANGARVAALDPASGTVTEHAVAGLDDRVYALATRPDGDLLACVAPAVDSWDPDVDFPSRLVALHPTSAAVSA